MSGAATPTGMSAVLGGDPVEVLAAIAAAGLTRPTTTAPARSWPPGLSTRFRSSSTPRRPRPGSSPQGGRRLPHRAHGPGRRGTWRPRPPVWRPTAPTCRSSPTETVPSSTMAPEVLSRLVSQVSNPVRWDLCMERLAELGVTGLIELPPSGTPCRARQARTQGVQTLAVKTRTTRGRPHDDRGARMSVESKGFAGALSGGAPVRHSRISGIGGYRPKLVVPNAEIVDRIDSSDEWIRERSGIIERRFAGPDEGIIEMTEWAAQPALEMAGIEGKDLDAVIMATVTWPYQTPAAAPLLAERLGSKGAASTSAACAGYCHGIALASDMVRTSQADNVLVLGVERLSDFTDPKDRGTAFIFGDGAGAAVVRPRTPPASARPSGDPTVPSGTRSRSARAGSTCTPGTSAGRRSAWPGRRSSGGRSGDGPGGAARARRRGHHGRSTRCLHPHQANVRIIDAMIKQLRLPPDIPVARDIAHRQHLRRLDSVGDGTMVRHGEIPRGGLAPRSVSAPASRMPRRSSSSPDPRVPARPAGHQRPTATVEFTRRSKAHGSKRAGDPRGSCRDRQRGDRPGPGRRPAGQVLHRDPDIDSLSMMTIVVNAEEKFGSASPTKRSRTSRPSVTPSPSSRSPRADTAPPALALRRSKCRDRPHLLRRSEHHARHAGHQARHHGI